jgi:hypothetical protein
MLQIAFLVVFRKLSMRIGASGIGMCLWCCWEDLDEQDSMEIHLLRFGFRMWEILFLKCFCR